MAKAAAALNAGLFIILLIMFLMAQQIGHTQKKIRPHPESVYGRTKLDGENAVLRIVKIHLFCEPAGFTQCMGKIFCVPCCAWLLSAMN